jgi:hypothetical protein
MLVSEDYTNETEGYRIGSSGLYEPYTDNIGKLFRSYQREYGRCISKVYIDMPDNKVQPVGWVFEKLAHYEDTHETYLQHVWVTLHDSKPDKHIEYHYHSLKGEN